MSFFGVCVLFSSLSLYRVVLVVLSVCVTYVGAVVGVLSLGFTVLQSPGVDLHQQWRPSACGSGQEWLCH